MLLDFLLNLVNCVDDGEAEAVFLKGGHADDGGTSRRADSVFHLARVICGFQGHFAEAGHHLGNQLVDHRSCQSVFAACVA